MGTTFSTVDADHTMPGPARRRPSGRTTFQLVGVGCQSISYLSTSRVRRKPESSECSTKHGRHYDSEREPI